jgi:hypothetical protein
VSPVDYQLGSVPALTTYLLSVIAPTVTGSGAVKRVTVVPGDAVAWDGCDCGQLALVTGQRYHSRQLWQQASDIAYPCVNAAVVVPFTLSLVRCTPGPDANGKPPKPADLAAAFAIQEADAYHLWSAVPCALRAVMVGMTQTPLIADFIVNTLDVVGASGDCAGVQLNFKVAWWDECGCGDA